MVNGHESWYSDFVKMQQKQKLGKIAGIISLNSKGVGFIPHPNGKEDIRIEPNKIHTALNRDEVEVVVVGKARGQNLGEVTQILIKSFIRTFSS